MKHIIHVKDLSKRYGNHTVLDGISFDVQKGTVFALLGANGAGKTTTINILSTLLLPDSGEIIVNGHDVVKDDQAVRASISVTGQYAAVDELLTAQENMRMIGRFSHLPEATIKARSDELLKQLDLETGANKRVESYSGGMRRRLDIAISLLAEPPLIFLDEPTTGLDPRSRKAIWEMVANLVHSGTTIFLTTQYLEGADQLADVIAVIDHGKIVARGTPEELKQQSGQSVAELRFATESAKQQAKVLLRDRVHNESNTGQLLEVSLDGTAASVRTLLNQLADAHCEPTTIQIRNPTIDDVFFALTDTKKAKGDEHAN